jgi:hypothetical protein
MVKVDRFQEGEATQLPFGRLTPLTYLPFLLYKGITDKGLRAIRNPFYLSRQLWKKNEHF